VFPPQLVLELPISHRTANPIPIKHAKTTNDLPLMLRLELF
jgi:hypothetical protein